MATINLTKRAVDSAKAITGGDVYLFDDEVKGFGLRVKPSGIKSFIFSYRVPAIIVQTVFHGSS